VASRTRTLQQLLDGVSDRADVVVDASAGTRHSNEKVTLRLNRAIQKWKTLLSKAGDDTNLKSSRLTTSTSATRDANNFAPYQYVVEPTGCMVIRGMDVWTGNTPIAMMPIDELERNDRATLWPWLGGSGAQTGMPVFYRIGGTRASDGANLIQIFPFADAVYTIDVRYVPAHVDLDDSSDLSTAVEFVCGGEDWVELDAAMETLRNDGLAGTPEYASMSVDKRMVERDMAFTIAKRGPTRKVDTVARRRNLMSLALRRAT
jgi:hypothetical protein